MVGEELGRKRLLLPGVLCVKKGEEKDDIVDEYTCGVVEALRQMIDADFEEQIVKFQELVGMTKEQEEHVNNVRDAV